MLIAWPAWAAVPQVQLSHSQPDRVLNGAMSVAVVPLAESPNPDVFWQLPAASTVAWPSDRWLLQPGQRVVGRVVLQGGRELDVYVVQVPVNRVDHVQVWWREPGQPWRSAEAGDRVPLSRWPFAGQFPAFALGMSEQPLELIVTAANDAPLALPVLIKTHASYLRGRLLQANLSGLILGLGLMAAVVSVIAAFALRRRASWVLVVYACWAFVVVLLVSGYGAVWFTPDWAEFNDKSKHFAGVVMAALLVLVVSEVLDGLDVWPVLRWLGPAVLVLGVAYGLAQAVGLPGGWRPRGGAGWAALCVALSAILCLISYWSGGRYVGLTAMAVACTAGAFALRYVDPGMIYGLDLRAFAAAVLLFASFLLLRHALFLRERYGRDVLGRAAISANRDPLTALLSFTGLQHHYEEAMLRQQAGRGPVAVMMFALPQVDQCGLDHGFVLTERGLVRFAAALHQVLGRGWSIGRLSKTRFAAVASGCPDQDAVVQIATRVLAHCTRIDEPVSPVADFDLRIVCAFLDGSPKPFPEVLRELEETGQAMESSKRIAVAAQLRAAAQAQAASQAAP
jgi:GGDEF domain-containing protein